MLIVQRRFRFGLGRSRIPSSSASAAVTLAREAQTPRFLNRSTSSAIVQRRDSPPERQAMTASLKSTLRAWISTTFFQGLAGIL